MSNTVHKIRDVEGFIKVLETAHAQGLHVKLGLFGRSLVVTELPMKNGVPQDKRISHNEASVARKLNQLVQRELKKAGQGASVAGLRERHIAQHPTTQAVATAFAGKVGHFDFAGFANTFNALKMPVDATPAQISFHQQLAEVADVAQRLEVPAMANWALAAGRALADEGRTPHQRLQELAQLTQPVAKDLGYLTAVMQEHDAHTLTDALAWVTGPNGLAERAKLPDASLPTTRAGLAAQMQDVGQRLRDEVRSMRSQGNLGGMRDHELVSLGDLGRDAARICGKDVPPAEALAEASALLSVHLRAHMPNEGSPVGLRRLAHELQTLTQHATWLAQQPVSSAEPVFVSKSEQTRRLQAHEGRNQLERDLNASLVQLKQLALDKLNAHPGNLQLLDFHEWVASKQDLLLSPKQAGHQNQRLDVIRAAIWDGRREMGAMMETRGLAFTDAEKSTIQALQDQFIAINNFLGAHHEPGAQEQQWLAAQGLGLSSALPLTQADLQALEREIQSLASQAVGALVVHARSTTDATDTQKAVEFLSHFAGDAVSEQDESRARVRLRNLVDVLEPGIQALDGQVQQAADRGDVNTAQLLVRLREQMATAHAAVYPPHAGPAVVPVTATLRQEVDRAELVAARRLSSTQAVGETVSASPAPSTPSAASTAASATPPVASAAPVVRVGAGGASAELPTNTIEASKELTTALRDAEALLRKFGHGKLRKVYGETVQAALRLLTENTHQAPAADRLTMARGLFDPLRVRMQNDLGPRGAAKSEKAVILPLLQALERSSL